MNSQGNTIKNHTPMFCTNQILEVKLVRYATNS